MSEKSPTCWTCRLRKKKCDKIRPICGACLLLGITCDTSPVRPAWVDNSRERGQQLRSFKAAIKQNVESRRNGSYLKVFSTQASTAERITTGNENCSLPTSRNERRSVNADLSATETRESRTGTSDLNFVHTRAISDAELELQITYLDYVFPFVFPFYQPSLADGGRSWVLASVRDPVALYHVAKSLTTYFVTLERPETGDTEEHRHLQEALSIKLDSHMSAAIQSVRRALAELSLGMEDASIQRKACLMESSTQLLSVFGTIMRKIPEGHVHITGAASIFKEIFGPTEANPDVVDLEEVLVILAKTSASGLGSPVWSPDQAAFRFYVAVLLYLDVISATSLGEPPLLQSYHRVLIADETETPFPDRRLWMEEFVGCPGWLLLLMAEIATISAERHQKERVMAVMLIKGGVESEKGSTGVFTSIKLVVSTGTALSLPLAQDRPRAGVHTGARKKRPTTSFGSMLSGCTV